MQISGLTSGVIRQAYGYAELLRLYGHSVSFLDHKTNIRDYDFALVFQHSYDVVPLLTRVKQKNPRIKIIFAPIFDPSSLLLLRRLSYHIPFENLKLTFSPRAMKLACDLSHLFLFALSGSIKQF